MLCLNRPGSRKASGPSMQGIHLELDSGGCWVGPFSLSVSRPESPWVSTGSQTGWRGRGGQGWCQRVWIRANLICLSPLCLPRVGVLSIPHSESGSQSGHLCLRTCQLALNRAQTSRELSVLPFKSKNMCQDAAQSVQMTHLSLGFPWRAQSEAALPVPLGMWTPRQA